MSKRIFRTNNKIFLFTSGEYFANPAATVTNRFSALLTGVILIALVFIFNATAAAQSNAETGKEWIGEYSFSDAARANKRRSSIDVAPGASYEIIVAERNGKIVASFSASGVQLFESYDCTTRMNDGKIEFYFQNVAEREVENFRNFKQGDLLFSLTKIKIAKAVRYLFEPAAYEIVRADPKKQKSAVYFTRR